MGSIIFAVGCAVISVTMAHNGLHTAAGAWMVACATFYSRTVIIISSKDKDE